MEKSNNIPLISCIIPTYKRNEKLARAIKSALSQTYSNIEVLVVDDNKPGDKYSNSVKKIVQSFSDNRVKYISQSKHINGAAARNAGVRASKGKYIAFLDDDDEWKPDKLEKQLYALKTNPSYKICSCYIEQYRDGVFISKRPAYDTNNLQYHVLKRDISVGTPTLLIEKDCFIASGGFNETLTRNQEIQLIAFLLEKSDMILVPEYLVITHMSFGADSNNPSASNIERIKLDFLNSVAGIIQKYSKKEQKLIFAANYFEIIYVALKERKLSLAIKYLLKIGFNIRAYYEVFNRFRARRRKKR